MLCSMSVGELAFEDLELLVDCTDMDFHIEG